MPPKSPKIWNTIGLLASCAVACACTGGAAITATTAMIATAGSIAGNVGAEHFSKLFSLTGMNFLGKKNPTGLHAELRQALITAASKALEQVKQEYPNPSEMAKVKRIINAWKKQAAGLLENGQTSLPAWNQLVSNEASLKSTLGSLGMELYAPNENYGQSKFRSFFLQIFPVFFANHFQAELERNQEAWLTWQVLQLNDQRKALAEIAQGNAAICQDVRALKELTLENFAQLHESFSKTVDEAMQQILRVGQVLEFPKTSNRLATHSLGGKIFESLPAEPDTFQLLRFAYRVTDFIRTDNLVEEITEKWVKEPGTEPIALLHGNGGVGKSRMAGEISLKLQNEGWWTKFIKKTDVDAVDSFFQHQVKGFLFVIDYPEEMDRLDDLLEKLHGIQSDSAVNLKILLVSRRNVPWWKEDSGINFRRLGNFINFRVFTIQGLGLDDACSLFKDTCKRLLEIKVGTQGSVDQINDKKFREWYFSDKETNSRPLFILAAAIYMVKIGRSNVSIDNQEIIVNLVIWEQMRMNEKGKAIGLMRETTSRLVSLAALSNGIDSDLLKRLADRKLSLNLPEFGHLHDIVQHSFLWHEEKVPPVSPDILAATLLGMELRKSPEFAKKWVWASLRKSVLKKDPNLPDRLGRLLHDMSTVYSEQDNALLDCLLQLTDKKSRALDFEYMTYEFRPGHFLLPLLIKIGNHLIQSTARDDKTLATRLTNLSTHLLWHNQNKEALKHAVQATQLWKKLIASDPTQEALKTEYQRSLHVLSMIWENNETQDKKGAEEAAWESVKINRELLASKPESVSRIDNLSQSLKQLGNVLKQQKEKERIEESKVVFDEAAKNYQHLISLHPQHLRFKNELARILFNRSVTFYLLEETEKCLEDISQSVALRKEIYINNPGRYSFDYSHSLEQLATVLHAKKDYRGAFEMMSECAIIREKLAKSNPMAYGITWLNTLFLKAETAKSNGESPMNYFENAVVAFDQLEKRGVFTEKSNINDLENLSGAIGNIGYMFTQSSDPQLGIRSCELCVQFLEKIKDQDPSRLSNVLLYNLIGSYLNLGNGLAKNNKRVEAIECYTKGLYLAEVSVEEKEVNQMLVFVKILFHANRANELLEIDETEEAIVNSQKALGFAENLVELKGDGWPDDNQKQIMKSFKILAKKLMKRQCAKDAVPILDYMIWSEKKLFENGLTKDSEYLVRHQLTKATALLSLQAEDSEVQLIELFHTVQQFLDGKVFETNTDKANKLNSFGFNILELFEGLTTFPELLSHIKDWLEEAIDIFVKEEDKNMEAFTRDSMSLYLLLFGKNALNLEALLQAKSESEKASTILDSIHQEKYALQCRERLNKIMIAIEEYKKRNDSNKKAIIN